MAGFTATEEKQYDEGIYRAKLLSLEDAEGGVDDEGYKKWTFELTDEEFAGDTLRANSSHKFGPRSKARQWAEALIGRRIQGGENVTDKELVGCEGDLMVRNVETDNGTFARVESVNPIRRKKNSGVADKQQAASEAKQPQTESQQADPDDEITESIPFS